ncbi:collagen triple helix repeat-containing protein 1-like [Glandiceps talaboti]
MRETPCYNQERVPDCSFDKKLSGTALRVTFNGNIRLRSGSTAASCARWYFTFDGVECSNPLPIESTIHTHGTRDVHRIASVEGFCFGIPAGGVDVEFRVGSCNNGMPLGDAYTGWNSVSRIIIEETAVI